MLESGVYSDDIIRVLHIIVSKLEELVNVDGNGEKRQGLIDPDYRPECQYLLQTLSNLMSCLSQNGWITLVSHSVSQAEHHEPETPESKFIRTVHETSAN